MAINIRAYSREEKGAGNTVQIHRPPPGTFQGLPTRPDFGGAVGPPSLHPARGNRGNNRSDVSIQVDVGSKTSNSADRMGRTGKTKSGKEASQYETPLYSREDIREQYCINKKEVDVLDRSSHISRRAKGFFGCLTSRKDHSVGKKKKRSSFFSALCVRRASEENLYNGCNKPVANTNRSVTLPALQPFTVPLRDDGSNSSSLFRNRPQSFCTTDPRRFSMQPTTTTPCVVNSYAPRHSDPDWKISNLPIQRTTSDAQDELEKMGSSQPYRYGGRLAYTQPNTPEMSLGLYRRQVMSSEALLDDRRSTGSISKHVSFDASSPCSEIYTSAVPANASKSQERLLDGRKTPEPFVDSKRHHQTAAFSPVLARAILLERLRQASMRSQATQTEGYYNSTTSLYYASCHSGAESQVSIPGAVSTVTRQVQTNFEPRSAKSRLTRSSSAVNQELTAGQHSDSQAEFQPLGRRPDELSQSQPEEIGDYQKTTSSPDRINEFATGSGKHPRSHRRRQLLKALSEGTILLDPKRARRFASGYVEVNVQDGPSPPEEEMVAGRVLVHDPARYFGSGSSEDDDEEDASFNKGEEQLLATSLPVRNVKKASSQDTNRSLGYSDDNDDGPLAWSDGDQHQPPLPLAEEPKSSRSLQAQKSFDSNASLPDTAGNYSDEFGSTSLVTVLQPHPTSVAGGDKSPTFVIACDSDLDPSQHPPTPPPRRLPPTPTPPTALPPPTTTGVETPATSTPPTTGEVAAAAAESGELSETEKEIMVQFPPWPGAQDTELIPAPPNFASTSGPSVEEEDKEEDDDFLPPPPPPEVLLVSPNKQMSERVLLRHLKHGSKSMSETMTSVDSDSSGRRMTEHETSSEPLSPTSELNSPQQEPDANNPNKPPDSADSSDAFLTALSDHLTTAGLTEVYNTAMERSERSYRESDTSHNSTLRMDTSAVQELPYECPSPSRPVEDLQPPAPLLTSPDSNNDGPEFGRDSSTSGSYSLEATPCASLSPIVPPPPLGPTTGKLPAESSLPVNPDAECSGARHHHPESMAAEASGQSIATGPTAVAAAAGPLSDKKTMKEGMKLQFLPGSTMFSTTGAATASPSTSHPPAGRSTGRRKHFMQQQQQSINAPSSTDSDDNNEDVGDRSTLRKRRNNKSSAAESTDPATKRTSDAKNSKHKKSSRNRDPAVTTPSSTHPDAGSGGARKRDSQIVATEATTPGMVRSPAMHEGFRMADWVAARSPRTSPPPPPLLPPQISGDDPASASNIFTLQHPSREGSCHDADPSTDSIIGSSWKLMAPSPSHQNCDSIRSVSPGSDNVFVSESVEMSGNGVVKPPEGFADSPAAAVVPSDWNLPTSTPTGMAVQPDRSAAPDGAAVGGVESKRKRDSGRSKRTKSCTLPASNLSASGLSLETAGTEAALAAAAAGGSQGPHRAVSTIDMWYPETQLPPKRQLTVRAKSEERERWNRPGRRNLVQSIRSVEASWDSLGSKLSCDGTPLDDEDAGIYNASYRAGAWAYIGETEELKVWRRSQPQTPLQETDDSSTASEKDFRRKYTSITHRMVHRKSSVEMFRRLATSTFDTSMMARDQDVGVLRHSLEDVYRLMLMIWCRESLALRRLSDDATSSECDDIVLVKRESGEFGFRIHGSRPVVVSAIEPGTPAESSGLQVGDIIISINDVNVLDSSHSEVVRIAHAGTDELKLEVARTCNVLVNPLTSEDQGGSGESTLVGSSSSSCSNEAPTLVGYLWKKSQSASRSDEANNVWYRRWFVLKRDNCLYYFKNQDSSQPLGAVSLLHYTVTRTSFTDRPHGLLLSKGGTIRHWLAAESTESVELWHSVFNHASKAAVQDVWLEMCAHNIQLPPASMASPDCLGHLMKLGHRAKEWQRRLCLLKDACLYFYVDINVSSALGALHLHGYRVQASGTTASSGERRKFAFELLPPEPRMRHFHFYTDSENDRKRWIAALEYSIDRWIRVG